MTINSLSGNVQITSQDFSGNSVPDKTEAVASKSAAITPIFDQQVSENKTTETSTTSAAEIAGRLNEGIAGNTPSFRQNIQRSLRFQVDDITGGTVIRVIDRQTQETIRQIPSEELLTLSRRLTQINEQVDSAVGVLLNLDA